MALNAQIDGGSPGCLLPFHERDLRTRKKTLTWLSVLTGGAHLSVRARETGPGSAAAGPCAREEEDRSWAGLAGSLRAGGPNPFFLFFPPFLIPEIFYNF